MSSETYQKDTPSSYRKVNWSASPLTDNEVRDEDLKEIQERGAELAKDSEHSWNPPTGYKRTYP